jgi:hypothetical protein
LGGKWQRSKIRKRRGWIEVKAVTNSEPKVGKNSLWQSKGAKKFKKYFHGKNYEFIKKLNILLPMPTNLPKNITKYSEPTLSRPAGIVRTGIMLTWSEACSNVTPGFLLKIKKHKNWENILKGKAIFKAVSTLGNKPHFCW